MTNNRTYHVITLCQGRTGSHPRAPGSYALAFGLRGPRLLVVRAAKGR